MLLNSPAGLGQVTGIHRTFFFSIRLWVQHIRLQVAIHSFFTLESWPPPSWSTSPALYLPSLSKQLPLSLKTERRKAWGNTTYRKNNVQPSTASMHYKPWCQRLLVTLHPVGQKERKMMIGAGEVGNSARGIFASYGRAGSYSFFFKQCVIQQIYIGHRLWCQIAIRPMLLHSRISVLRQSGIPGSWIVPSRSIFPWQSS